MDAEENSVEDFVFFESETNVLIRKKGKTDDLENKCQKEEIFLVIEPPENFNKKWLFL